MATVGAYEAKTRLSELLDRVERGERIVITRHGVVIAVLQPPESRAPSNVDETIRALREFRRGRRATGEEIASWIAEGRD
ncbi:type II toxin-antitoxin system prevent-host-death family antitoxin [Myxococcota bacterium]|nr:type II toxin-antitoxin system prevent-host-death family antitoxin [Myxococcota bacterium]